ncbi:hypothetical protein GCM10010346_52720 [Streptomyces chryseus]|uniref:Uncharacterized protein n=1 Tax=Streptomyces chryseus TaxID=68186 RepID=A0ABQ3E877_9ACTN|nr:hypothetical protein GCM10010346_52720 [Streptomyces chryseus]
MLVPVVDEPIGELLGPFAGLGRAEVIQEQQRAAGQRLEFSFAVVAGAGAEPRVEVGGGDGLPAQADASGEEGTDGAVCLVGLAGAGGAGDQQRRAFGDAGAGRPGASGAGDLVSPGSDLGVVGQGAAVAGGDAGVGEFQGGDRLGRRRVCGSSGGVDAAVGEDRVEPVGDRADGLGCAGEGGGQSSSP